MNFITKYESTMFTIIYRDRALVECAWEVVAPTLCEWHDQQCCLKLFDEAQSTDGVFSTRRNYIKLLVELDVHNIIPF